jgi:hypothetical protein
MIALVLTVCSFSACNGYYIDQFDTQSDCSTQSVIVNSQLPSVGDRSLQGFLDQYNIHEKASNVKQTRLFCKHLPDDTLVPDKQDGDDDSIWPNEESNDD